MQPLELDEGGVAGGTAGQHGPYFTPTARLRQACCVLATARRPLAARVNITGMRLLVLVLSASLAAVAPAAAQTRRPAAGAPRVYTATLPVEKMPNKQAVVDDDRRDVRHRPAARRSRPIMSATS